MIVVDASVIVSYFMPQEKNHPISYRWLTAQISANNSLVAPTIVLSEVACAIARVTGQNSKADAAIEMLLKLPMLKLVTIDRTIGIAAAQLGVKARLRGTDAVYAAVADNLKMPLISWDKEHLQRAGNFLTVKTPS